MEIIGKAPVNKFVFITGKFSMYASWGFIPVQMFFYDLRLFQVPILSSYLCLFFAFIGLFIFLIATVNLGRSLRFGLPTGFTEFKTSGLYRFSRNPLYLGFYMMGIASVVFTVNLLVALLVVYGIVTFHKIILAEEEFMRNEFGEKYNEYCRKVRRYI